MFDGNTLASIGAIAFDLDDTLFDAGAWTVEALRHAAVVRGMRPECVDRAIDEFLQHGSPHDPAFYNAILSGCSQSDTALNIRALHEATLSYRGQGSEWEPFPGVRDALIELSWSHRLAIVADGPLEAQQAKLDALGLGPLIDLVVFSDAIDGQRSRRPDPRPYRRLQEGLGLPAAEILFVGDHPVRDFKTARQLGFPTCRVFTGPLRQTPYPDASHCALKELTSAARLPEMLREDQLRQGSKLLSQMPFLNAPARSEANNEQAVLSTPATAEPLPVLPLAASVTTPERTIQFEPAAALPATDGDAAQTETGAPGAYASPATLRRSLELLPEPERVIACNPQPQQRSALVAAMHERLPRRQTLIGSQMLGDSPLG